jgi:hypothetical protein
MRYEPHQSRVQVTPEHTLNANGIGVFRLWVKASAFAVGAEKLVVIARALAGQMTRVTADGWRFADEKRWRVFSIRPVALIREVQVSLCEIRSAFQFKSCRERLTLNPPVD